MTNILNDRLRRRAEQALNDGGFEGAEFPATTLKELVHELYVHQAELEIQNEELRTAQQALEASRIQYLQLFQSVPLACFTVNAAGIANANPAEEMEEAQFQTMMDINLKGVFLSCQAEARAMLRHGRGSIVNIASMSGVIVNRGLSQCHYNASKAGVIHMTKSMAMEWVGRGIRVNTISPGYTATPMNTRPEMVHQTKLFEEQTPMQRMAHVDEMVGPAVFLLSNAASFVTGVDLLVDGGFCCW